MARPDSQDPLLPSLVDRLIDRDPDVSTEPAWRQSQNLREYEQSVLRDVEALLNTRQTVSDLPADFAEATQSILTYGLPEFLSLTVSSPHERDRLGQSVEQTLTRFEPRLRQVSVQVADPKGASDRAIRMVISAMLWVEPNPVPITFDTEVQPGSGTCTVKAR